MIYPSLEDGYYHKVVVSYLRILLQQLIRKQKAPTMGNTSEGTLRNRRRIRTRRHDHSSTNSKASPLLEKLAFNGANFIAVFN